MRELISSNRIGLKRAYERPAADDGTRVLVDRLWPRGVKNADAQIHEWMKEIAPSTRLRKWFNHDPARWEEFQTKYRSELREHAEVLDRLRSLALHGRVTLIYAARDKVHNDAVVIRDVLLG